MRRRGPIQYVFVTKNQSYAGHQGHNGDRYTVPVPTGLTVSQGRQMNDKCDLFVNRQVLCAADGARGADS